jgi:hypothetical protein
MSMLQFDDDAARRSQRLSATPMNTVARDLTSSQSWVSIDEGDALARPYADGMFPAAVSTHAYECGAWRT